jgi:enamine deaminase RidA (YjgF/YER057c/UK114 family)
VTDITYFDQNSRRSCAVMHNGTVYLAGQTAGDRTADIGGQTQQVLAKIDEILAAVGTDKSRLLNATIWLASMDDFAGMNAVYDAWLVDGRRPARCCGAMELAAPHIKVEIMVVAAA